jgi:hypothetical protein
MRAKGCSRSQSCTKQEMQCGAQNPEVQQKMQQETQCWVQNP